MLFQYLRKRTLSGVKRQPFYQRYSSSFRAGQPIHETRPHLIQKGELTPGITAEEYYLRRMKILASIPDKSMVVVPGNETQFATGSVFHEFRQDPNFYYLTGFLEPSSALILYRESGESMHSIFFVPENDTNAELWDGERTGTQGALDIFNADAAYPFDQISQYIHELLKICDNIYTDLSENGSRFPRFFKSQGTDILNGSFVDILRRVDTKKALKSTVTLVEQFRVNKSEEEIDAMRTAAEISASAYNKAYGERFATEKALHAYLDYEFKLGGCEMPAYLPVVAGGSHALTIHYTRNDDRLRDGDLVLVDAGGRYGGYCADISRTWPVNGKFSAPQRDLYQALLNAQKKCIEYCTVDANMNFNDLHKISEDLLYTELLNAGMTTLTRSRIRDLYPHYIGHHLGIDVHDIKTSSRFDKFQSGQVITIEPGVYVPDSEMWPKHFRNMGIRIEDNVVIGKNSYEVLTVDTAKEIDEIEALAERRESS